MPTHNYGFYSVTHDHAGNVETPHSTADTSTTANVLALPSSISPARSVSGQIDRPILTIPRSPGYNYLVEYREDVTREPFGSRCPARHKTVER